MHIHSLALTFAASVALAGCTKSPSEVEFQYWVIDTAKPSTDIVLLIDGETHSLPVAISISDISAKWHSGRASDSRVESSIGPLSFAVESSSGQAIAWNTDLLYSSSSRSLTGIKYSVFFPESDKQYVQEQWVQPDAAFLLIDIEKGKLPKLSR